MKTVRIGAGQGFYGDSLLPVLDVARHGDVKYIAFDTLAELTLAILEKGRKKDPEQGYTKDVVPMMHNLLPLCRERGIRLVTNAGGINPPGAARAVARVAKELGLPLKIAIVTGDDVSERLPELVKKHHLKDKETGRPLDEIAGSLYFSSVYLGADTIRRALDTGADVVITGRTTDTAQFLGPILHEFGWAEDDWDKLAQGIILGHLMECSGQVTGGNLSVGWQDVPELERIGYPVDEESEDGSFVLTNPAGTGAGGSPDTAVDTFTGCVARTVHSASIPGGATLTMEPNADLAARCTSSGAKRVAFILRSFMSSNWSA